MRILTNNFPKLIATLRASGLYYDFQILSNFQMQKLTNLLLVFTHFSVKII